MDTLLLDDKWDLPVIDGNLFVVATGSLAIAQDVATAERTFLKECWYNWNLGVDWLSILGKRPSIQYVKNQLIAVGMTVPGVVGIVCYLTGPGTDRKISGQLQITDNTGAVSVVGGPLQAGVAPWYVQAVSPDAAQPTPGSGGYGQGGYGQGPYGQGSYGTGVR